MHAYRVIRCIYYVQVRAELGLLRGQEFFYALQFFHYDWIDLLVPLWKVLTNSHLKLLSYFGVLQMLGCYLDNVILPSAFVALIFRGLDALTTEDNVKAALAAITAIVPKNVHILRDTYTGTSLG